MGNAKDYSESGMMTIKDLYRTLIGVKEREWKHEKLERKVHQSLGSIECERQTKGLLLKKNDK